MEHHGTRRAALQGLVAPVLTVAVVAGGSAAGRGDGVPPLLHAAVVAGLVALVLGALLVAVVVALTRPGDRTPADELADQWARVEPLWSGRR